MDAFDLDLGDVLEAAGAFDSTNRNDDRRVCACGHGMSRHKFNDKSNRHMCLPGRLACPCLIPKAVLSTPNTRYFMRKSQGSGKSHALSMGYAASKEALGDDAFSDKVEWLIEPKCEFCGTATPYYPVRVTRTGQVIFDSDENEDEGVTVFLCSECRDPIAHGK